MNCIVLNCKGEAVNDVEHCIPCNQTELLTYIRYLQHLVLPCSNGVCLINKKNTYIHAYIHTYIHITRTLIHKCVTKTVAGGISHKYTNVHNFFSVKYCKLFTKEYCRSLLLIKNYLQTKVSCVYKYFLKATLNFA